ncbi:MAG: FAD-dependent oxidoreductase [Candidatus Dormibacter sp.]
MVVTSSPGPSDADHVVVIGAGPAGLSAAVELARRGTPVTVLETDAGSVAGAAGTVEFMGCRFDGASRLFSTELDDVWTLWSETLGEEMGPVGPPARIYYRGRTLSDPIDPSSAYLALGLADGARCLAGYAQARLRPVTPVRSFADRLSNEVGRRWFSIFGKTYLEKVWGVPIAGLSADWAVWPISALQRADGPAGSVGWYPRQGAGQLWQAMATRLQATGNRVWMGQEVVAVRHARGRVIGITVRDSGGRSIDVLGSHFISTLPVGELIRRLWPAAPTVVRSAADALAYRAVITVNVVLDRAEVFPDRALAIHDPAVRMARVTNWKNFSPEMVADPGLTGLGIEYFCTDADDLWAMSDADLLDLGRRELMALGLCGPEDVKTGIVCRLPKAYAVYDRPGEDPLAVIIEWLERALPNLRLIERSGIHDHDRVDDPTAEAMLLARSLATRPAVRASRRAPDAQHAELGQEGGYTGASFRSGVAQR